MAGQIKVDSINADSNLTLKIANTAVAFIDATGLRPTSGNVSLDATATSKFYLPSANTVAIQTAGVTGLSISSSQVVTLANALPVTSGGTGVTTSTGTGAVVLGTSPVLTTPNLGTPSALVLTNATGLPQAGLGTNVVGNGPAFSASKSNSQNISSDTVTKILFDTENFDTNNNFASSRFTPTVAGYYIICCAIYWVNGTGSFVNLNIFKNGSGIIELARNTQASGVIGGSSVVYCDGSTDYIELYFYSASGTCLLGSNVTVVNFNGAMIRSA